MNLLAALAAAGVLERAGRPRTVLRIAPRFLAHAQAAARATTGRLGAAALETALGTWDEFRHDPRAGALLLERYAAEQATVVLGLPALESFPEAAA